MSCQLAFVLFCGWDVIEAIRQQPGQPSGDHSVEISCKSPFRCKCSTATCLRVRLWLLWKSNQPTQLKFVCIGTLHIVQWLNFIHLYISFNTGPPPKTQPNEPKTARQGPVLAFFWEAGRDKEKLVHAATNLTADSTKQQAKTRNGQAPK